MADTVIYEASPRRSLPFIGRGRELAELEGELRLAMSGRLRTVMVIGEPGIGKTTLAEQLALSASAGGARVVWGRCWDGSGSRPYWPWVQLTRSLSETSTTRNDGSDGEPAAAPDVLGHLLALDPDSGVTAGSPRRPRDRAVLFDSVAEMIVRISGEQPLVVVLDDLHQADAASLVLLQFVVRFLRHSRTMFVCTYRDAEVGRNHRLLEPLGQLARESTRLTLRGLSEDAVRAVMEEITGTRPAPELVKTVHAHTDGNPFFVTEVVRQLGAGKPAIAAAIPERGFEIPTGVKEMIGAQLRSLSSTAESVLELAAVIGQRFGATMLERVMGLSGEAVINALNEAVEAHLVRQEGDGPDRFAFVHSLTRETVYEYMGPAERSSLHRRVGETFEEMAAGDDVPFLADLAHHFYEALPGADPAKALDYAVRAGRQADCRLAYEEAARYFEKALAALDLVGGDPRRRCRLLLELGDARAKTAAAVEAQEVFDVAAETARRLGEAELFAEAALRYGGRFVGQQPGRVDDRLVALLEEAIDGLGDGDSPLRASLLARLSRAVYYAGHGGRQRQLAQQALEMAGRCADDDARLAALNSRYWSLGCPEESDARLATVREMLALAEAAGDKEMALQAHHWLLIELAERGQMTDVDAEIAAYRLLAGEIRQPLYRWYGEQFLVMRALMSGRFADAERMAREAAGQWRERLGGVAVDALLDVQLFDIWWQQGRYTEASARLHGVEPPDRDPNSRTVVALVAFRFDDVDKARDEFEQLVTPDLGALPHDVLWMGRVAVLATLCAGLGDTERAPVLHDVLLPYRERNVVVGGGVACPGPVSYYLGLLAATAGRPWEAVAHLEDALARTTAMGARPQVAWAKYELARVLVSEAPRVRNQRAIQLLSETVLTAEELGMRTLMRRAMKLRHRARRAGSAAAGGNAERPRAVPRGMNVFCAEGDRWSIEFEGTGLQLKDSKGLRYLHKLLEFPGRELHVANLADDPGAIDAPRAAAERLRKAVTNRINAAIRTLETRDPKLAKHLSTSIRTGRFCSYRPAEPTRWLL